MRLGAWTAGLGLVALCAMAAPAQAGFRGDVMAASKALFEWDLPTATKLLDGLRSNPRFEEVGEALLVRGRYELMMGRYAEAAKVLAKGSGAPGLPADITALIKHYAALAAGTDEVTRGYKSHTTSGGHFSILYKPGVDEVLLPYADRMLERAWRELTVLFDHVPPAPVRVEIYPNVEVLGQVSSLTVKEIKTSGTIALCKYNRLMIISPRDLVYGYGWLDTLAHEFIHLLVTQKSRNQVPIWLHEGLAKYYEGKWQGRPPALSRSAEDLLARAVKSDQLIAFSAMSPSMAKLPSQEATATAFAEVHMVMEYLESRSGSEVAAELPRLMASGLSDKQAVSALARMPWKRFEPSWKAFLKTRRLRRLKVKANKEKLLFKGDDNESVELAELGEQRSRDHTWLGDRLRMKGRYQAAAKQYRRAAKFEGPATAIVQAKLGHALLRLGRLEAAIIELRKPLALAANYVLLHLYLGEACLRLGRLEQAREHLESVVALNPFDPSVHGHLATVYTKMKLQARAAEERKLHKRLQVHIQ